MLISTVVSILGEHYVTPRIYKPMDNENQQAITEVSSALSSAARKGDLENAGVYRMVRPLVPDVLASSGQLAFAARRGTIEQVKGRQRASLLDIFQ